jgi:hypothetical protein
LSKHDRSQALSFSGWVSLGWRKRRTPGLLAAVEDLGQEGKKNRPSGKKEDHDHGDDLRDLLQVLPDLPELIPSPFLARVSVLHEEAHEALDLHHLPPDELPVPEKEIPDVGRDLPGEIGRSPAEGTELLPRGPLAEGFFLS